MTREPIIHFSSLLDRAALEHLKSKTLLPSFSHYDVWLYEHAVGFTVAKMMNADLLQTTKSALEHAMQSGESYDKFVKKLKPYLMAQGWWGESVMTDPVDGVAKTVQLGSTRRLRVIFQTNMATAYAAGQWARVQEDKTDFPYLKYIASTAEQKRASHMTYYGKIWRVDDPIWQSIFPPNGYGCQCTVRQLNEKQALRERGEDISRQPEKFTERQKANHAKGVIDDGTDGIQWIDFINPRTGQTVKIPFDVTPTFAHNHGDRLGALQKLMQDKHGTEKGAMFEKMLDDYLFGKIKLSDAQLIDFSEIIPNQDEINRLAHDPNGSDKSAIMEATVGAKWQQYFAVTLERPPKREAIKGQKTQKGVDFIVVNPDNADKETWIKLDLMYAFEEDVNIDEMIRTINKSGRAWEKHTLTILNHLQKADIVPMYLPMLDWKSRSKIIAFVLSLPQEQQKQIVFILDKLS